MALALEPWPLQPYQRGATCQNTAFKMPPIPGATGIMFWLNMASIGNDAFLLDCRDGASAYWYNGEAGPSGLRPAQIRGVQQSVFGFGELLGAGWSKVIVQAPDATQFANGFHLLSRVSNEQFVNGQLGLVQVLSRLLMPEELASPRGPAPADAVAASYDFSDVSGGLLHDVSGHGYHAQLIGNAPVPFGF